jgi:hypothetical protein
MVIEIPTSICPPIVDRKRSILNPSIIYPNIRLKNSNFTTIPDFIEKDTLELL